MRLAPGDALQAVQIGPGTVDAVVSYQENGSQTSLKNTNIRISTLYHKYYQTWFEPSDPIAHNGTLSICSVDSHTRIRWATILIGPHANRADSNRNIWSVLIIGIILVLIYFAYVLWRCMKPITNPVTLHPCDDDDNEPLIIASSLGNGAIIEK